MHLEDFKGTVSHGTMRECDLFPAFLSTLKALLDVRLQDARRTDPYAECADVLTALERIGAIGMKAAKGRDYFDTDSSHWDLQWLFDALDQFGPEGYYFGSHVGDGSDYGFWQHEENE